MIVSTYNDTVAMVDFCKITGNYDGEKENWKAQPARSNCLQQFVALLFEMFNPLPSDWSRAPPFLLFGSLDRKLSKDICDGEIKKQVRKNYIASTYICLYTHFKAWNERSITLTVAIWVLPMMCCNRKLC